MNNPEIQEIVFSAIRNLNIARSPEDKLEINPTSPIFGINSPLDSIGLISLIIDIEELLHEKGYHITLADARAVTQRKNPFRDVPSMISHINARIAETRS